MTKSQIKWRPGDQATKKQNINITIEINLAAILTANYIVIKGINNALNQ